jgi:hypothetical protein
MAERTSDREYEVRVANLTGAGSGDRQNGDTFLTLLPFPMMTKRMY